MGPFPRHSTVSYFPGLGFWISLRVFLFLSFVWILFAISAFQVDFTRAFFKEVLRWSPIYVFGMFLNPSFLFKAYDLAGVLVFLRECRPTPDLRHSYFPT